MSMLKDVDVPILIVGYRNPVDIVVCLSALTKLRTAERFCVMICENGGPEAFDRLLAALTSPVGPCVHEGMSAPGDKPIKRAAQLVLEPVGAPVFVAEANENLGFAGGVNAWLRPLLAERGWKGVWVLNPDTWPEPDALSELVRAAEERGKGLVGSRVMFPGRTDIGSSRGLRWRKLWASTEGVDIFAPVDPPPDPADVEARIESPSGVSLYATRACLDSVGLLDERYFLYFEDFDWGVRAKASCGIGYAHGSVVPHIGGSSTGAVRSRAQRSQLAVYLTYRNRMLFVRQHYPHWYWWTAFVSLLRSAEFLIVGSVANFTIALRGLSAGLRGETGRPSLS
jgi:GT2 family glycosyltransferase